MAERRAGVHAPRPTLSETGPVAIPTSASEGRVSGSMYFGSMGERERIDWSRKPYESSPGGLTRNPFAPPFRTRRARVNGCSPLGQSPHRA
jgi:hypothetical protein